MRRPVEQAWLDQEVADLAWSQAHGVADELVGIAERQESCESRLRAIVEALGKADMLAWVAPHEKPLSSTALLLIRERLAWSSSLADLAFAMQGLGSYPITSRGSAALQQKYLPQVRAGETVAAIALTEPEAGSDLGNVQTEYKKSEDGYLLSGEKVLISNVPEADFYCVLARSEIRDARRPFSMFVIPADAKGLEAASTPVLGDHPIGRLTLSSVRVPKENRIAEEGDGMGIALGTLHRFRPSVGAAALGFAARAFSETVAHVQTRRQFGAPLADLQAVQLRLADMATELESARLLVYRAAAVFDGLLGSAGKGHQRSYEARVGSMAKLVATENASRVIDQAIQLHGGRGVQRGSVVAHLYNEVRALRIYEGASDVQRILLARSSLKEQTG